jgi:hypothetical protein
VISSRTATASWRGSGTTPCLAFPAKDALWARGRAFRDVDPVRALETLRRGLVIAQDSGNRGSESLLALDLSRFDAEYGDPLAALDHVTLAIRTFHDAGNALIRNPLTMFAALFERLGRYEPAAAVAGFAFSPLTAAACPEINTAIATSARSAATRPTNRLLARVRR